MSDLDDMANHEEQDDECSKNSAYSHDKRYKRLFSNSLIVEELMRYFVEEKFVDELDFSKMELQNTSFVNEEHKKSEADMIWKINYKGKDIYIYLLIEFQSSVDKFMALRFGSYIFEFYKWLLAADKNIDKLPAVFPILIYNGNKRWTAVDNIKDLINSGSIPADYIPAFRYYKVIENEISREKLLKIHNALSMVFFVENASAEEIKSSLDLVYKLLEEEEPALIKEFSLWFNNLLETSGYEMGNNRFTIEKLNNLKEVKTMFSTALKEHEEKYKQIGIKQGIQQGIQKGMQKGLEKGMQKGMQKKANDIALTMLAKNADIQFIIDVTGLSAEQIEQLKLN